MRLQNELPFPAHVLRVTRPGEDFVRMTAIVKQTFDIHPDGSLTTSPQQLPITAAPTPTHYGHLGGDHFPRKDGVDVCVLGTMRLAQPTRVQVAMLRIGELVHQVRVTGDRRWVRLGGQLVPSEPEPFVEMPLSYARSFGGTSQFRHQPAVWADNPEGRGYYLSEEHAEGQLLPNLELVGEPPITRWDQTPRAAGWGPYPFSWGLQQPHCVVHDGLKVKALLPRMFNSAHPDLVLPSASYPALWIDGVLPTPFAVAIPSHELRAVAEVGGRVIEARTALDGIYVWLDHRKLVLTRRAHVRYPFRRGERRTTTLLAS